MKEKLPVDILILAGRLSLEGVVTVCENSARMLRVVDKNWDKLSKPSACTGILSKKAITKGKTKT